MRRILLKTLFALATLGSAIHALAADGAPESAPASYAVLSLVGHDMRLVYYVSQTSDYIGSTRPHQYDTNSTLFDDAAAAGVRDALTQARSEVAVKALQTSDTALFEAQDKLFQAGSDNGASKEALRALLKDTGATRVIVLTNYKGAAHLKMPTLNLYLGSGKLEGIGYYVDNNKRVRAESGEPGKGFVAPYAYIKATLLDAKTLDVIGEQFAIDSDTLINQTASRDVWLATPDDQKATSLINVVHAAAHDATANLLQALLADKRS